MIMILRKDRRNGLFLLIVFLLLLQNSDLASFPQQTAAAEENREHSGTTCEEYLDKKCDPVTKECRPVKAVVKCPAPSTPSGRSQCFASWVNTVGVHILKKGCWSNGRHCQRQCQQRDPVSVTGVHFCCCEGDLCNQNITVHNSTVTVSSGTTTLFPPVVKDTKQAIKTISFTIVPIVVVAVVVVVVCYVWKRRQQNFYTGHQQLPTIDPAYLANPSPTSLNLDQIERIELRARGRFGWVWKAKLGSDVVALKVFPLQDKQSWLTEQEIYSLPQMSHENILKFVAREKRGEDASAELWLLTEFHENGSLYDYLKGHVLTWAQLCKIAETMARGLAFLHDELPATNLLGSKPAIAHRDFKSKNVLLKGDLSACVADFGLAIKFEPGNSPGEIHGLVGTRRYMAPEVLEGAICFNRDAFLRIDMYACSLVLWELLTRCGAAEGPVGEYQLPFESAEEVGPHPTLEAMQDYVVTRKKRPPILQHWKLHTGMASLVSTVEECWDQDAEARLSAGCVEERMASMTRSVSITGFTTGSPPEAPVPTSPPPPPPPPCQSPSHSDDTVVLCSPSSDTLPKENSSCC